MKKIFLNDDVLVQLECTEENEKNVYNVVVFFRHTHKVEILKYKSQEIALKKYNFVIDLCNKC